MRQLSRVVFMSHAPSPIESVMGRNHDVGRCDFSSHASLGSMTPVTRDNCGSAAFQRGEPEVLPTWMTTDYIESLITKIDIGRVYPDLVKSKLLDDPTESARREELYTSQLRIQLPMLALEGKIRGRGNIDERGYRYVAALMEPEEADRKVDGQPIVLRRLAFISQQKLIPSEDIVTNMFVIGPKNPDAGPCLLYRPLLEPQLCHYPSSSNLL